jgi:ketosteroid isomerase-like protein
MTPKIKTHMSNEELIKQFYVAFKNKDEKTNLKLFDENIEWITMDEMPNGGTYNGKKQVFENYFPNMLSHFKEFHAIPEQITGLKDHVMVTGRYQGVSKQDKEFDVSFSHVYLVEENKIKQFRQFTDAQKIQETLN